MSDVRSNLENSKKLNEHSSQQHQKEILHFKEELATITKDLQQENSTLMKEKLALEQLVILWKK